MKQTVIILALMTVGATLYADTLTWKGGLTNSFATAANWTSAATGQDAAPAPGDTLKVTSETVWTDGSFDLGTAGITIENAAIVRCGVAFSGEGRLVKKGSGFFYQNKACTHAGGTEIAAGTLQPNVKNSTDLLGSGKIYITGSGMLEAGFQTFTKEIEISGDSRRAISIVNEATFNCPVTGTCDFLVNVGWGRGDFKKPIRAPGQKITLTSNGENRTINLYDTVTAKSIEKKSVNFLYAEKDLLVESITLTGGELRMGTQMCCTATTVSLTGGSIALQGRYNLALAAITAKSGCTVKSLYQYALINSLQAEGGEPVAPGLYEASDLAGLLDASSKTVFVLGGASVAYWQGGSEGAWSLGANWSTGVAPKDGAVAVVTNVTSFAEEAFDIGTGLSVISDVMITNQVNFSGPGVYRVFGTGETRYRVNIARSGETFLYGGAVCVPVAKPKFLGTNTVTFVTDDAGGGPTVFFPSWNTEIASPLVFTGARTSYQITQGNPGKISGKITSDSNLSIGCNWGHFTITGDIEGHGKSLKLKGNANTSTGDSSFSGNIDMSIDKSGGGGNLYLTGVSTVPGNTLAVSNGVLGISATGKWAGTEVLVGPSGTFSLAAADNLPKEANLTVATGGKINIASGVKVCVASLSLGGTPLPSGTYTAANRSDLITGAGRLRVGNSGMVVIFR